MPTPGTIDFATLIGPAAHRLWGKPNAALSNGHEIRWGANGARSINLEKGTWYDFEAGEGGGVVDLIRREAGTEDAIGWLAGQGLIERPTAEPERKITHTYDYNDEDGALLFQVVRYEPKDFRQRRRGANGNWVWNLDGTRRVLYNLPRVLEAIADGQSVVVVEGERDVESLRALDIVATTCPQGANKWRAEYNASLAGADVILVPDNDPAGRDHMHTVGVSLKGVARRIRVIDLATVWPQCPPKGDISDWVDGGGTTEQFLALAEAAPDWTLTPDTDDAIILTLPQFLARLRQPNYLVDGLFQRGFLYSLTAMTGGGKTAVALALSVAVADPQHRWKFGPHEVEHGRVIYVSRENSDDVRQRLTGMAEIMGFSAEELAFLVIEDAIDLAKSLERIKRESEPHGEIALIVLDTSAALFVGDDENNSIEMLKHAKTQRSLTELPGRPTVLALNHPIKRPTGPEQLLPRGGSGYLNEVDGNFTLWAHDDKLSDFHWTGKLRGPDFEKIIFHMTSVTTLKLQDAKGRTISTVMARTVTDADAAESETKAAFQEDRLLKVIAANPKGSLGSWAIACEWTFDKDGQRQPNKSLVVRVLRRLKSSKLVAQEGRAHVLTKAGQKTLDETPVRLDDGEED
jgi:hypothetical protein